MSTTLYVRDGDLNRVAEIDDYLDCSLVPRYNAVGAWTLSLSADSRAVPLLMADGAGLIAIRDGETLFSGPVRNRARSYDQNTDAFSVGGPDDLCWVAGRLARPKQPGDSFITAAPGGWNAAHDFRVDVAETVIYQYVNANINPVWTIPERGMAGFIVAPSFGRGPTVHAQARFDNLLELIQGVGEVGGIGFRARWQASAGAIVFETYQPSDHSLDVLFAPERGNLVGYQWEEGAPEANWVTVGGGGEMEARLFLEGGDPAAIARWGRIEEFRDRRDTTDASQMQGSIDEELTTKAARQSLAFTPLDTDSLRFGRDYDLGDLVTVLVGDTPVAEVVREVSIRLSADGETLAPTLGTPTKPAGSFGSLAETLRRLLAGVSFLERQK